MTEEVENEQYKTLLAKVKEIQILNNAIGVIYWDMETNMPKKGIKQRSEELALLSGIIHDKQVDPEIGKLLTALQKKSVYKTLSDVQKRNIYLIQRAYDQQTKLPKELVVELAKETSLAIEVWKKAKAESNYELFKPALAKILELVKKQAHYLDPDKHPYDVLLDLYEPGFNREIIDKLFNELRDGLVPLIKKILKAKQPDYSLVARECPIALQKTMAEDITKMVRYDLTRGRIDEAVHPFTIGYYDDVRITTRYNKEDFTSSFYAVLHEGGHALYEQNMPEEYKFQPVGSYCSMGMHESQSRFIENILGRSKEFWEFYMPRFKELTGKRFKDVKLGPFVKAINRVVPSEIRVEADPVTYSLHVILRFEIEKDLFEGKITVDDLPKVWNKKMKEYLDIDIEDDAKGVLQDTHWAGGSFGYFPDYALGNIYDGQLLWALEEDVPNWREFVKNGQFGPVIDWLIANVHKKGNLWDPLDLIQEITGKELSTKYYLDYLEQEYSKLYDL